MVATALEAVVHANHFGVMQIHNPKQTMIEKGVSFDRDCLIFESANHNKQNWFSMKT